MVDFFLLLMLAGAGDELQGIKRGIMEMADAIIINKADGNNRQKAELARLEYKNALHLYPATASGWEVPVEMCSALENEGIDDIWEVIEQYRSMMTTENNFFFQKRKEQTVQTMYDSIDQQLNERFYRNEAVKKRIAQIEKDVLAGKISAYQAAGELLKIG